MWPLPITISFLCSAILAVYLTRNPPSWRILIWVCGLALITASASLAAGYIFMQGFANSLPGSEWSARHHFFGGSLVALLIQLCLSCWWWGALLCYRGKAIWGIALILVGIGIAIPIPVCLFGASSY